MKGSLATSSVLLVTLSAPLLNVQSVKKTFKSGPKNYCLCFDVFSSKACVDEDQLLVLELNCYKMDRELFAVC